MKKTAVLKFQKSKNSKKNIEIFFSFLKRHKSHYSSILLDVLKKNISDEEFRHEIKDNVLAYIEKTTSRIK